MLSHCGSHPHVHDVGWIQDLGFEVFRGKDGRYPVSESVVKSDSTASGVQS